MQLDRILGPERRSPRKAISYLSLFRKFEDGCSMTISRLVCASILIMLFCGITGCAYFGIGNSEWRRHSILPNDRSIEELNAIANNPTNSQNERAIAVFKLFAHHIPPGSNAKDVHRVLTNATWLNTNDAPINESNIIGGYIPVEVNGHDSLFVMYLFPEKGKHVWSPWVIYMRLSGKAGLSGAPRSAEVAYAFLDRRHDSVWKLHTTGIRVMFPG